MREVSQPRLQSQGMRQGQLQTTAVQLLSQQAIFRCEGCQRCRACGQEWARAQMKEERGSQPWFCKQCRVKRRT